MMDVQIHHHQLRQAALSVRHNGSMQNISEDGIDYLAHDDEPYDTQAHQAEVLAVICFLAVLSVIGTAGNAIVLYVFYKKKDNQVSTLFIIVLAFVDLTTCLVVIPYTVVLESRNFLIDYDFLCKLYQFLLTSNIPFSALIMVAIAIDRYLCICHPFLHALNLTRAKIMTFFMFVLSASIGVIVALMHGVYNYFGKVHVGDNYTYHMGDGEDHGFKPHVNMSDAPNNYRPHPMDDGANDHLLATDQTNGSFYHPRYYVHPNDTHIIVFVGQCRPNELIISAEFRVWYQRMYTGLYLICLVVVMVLYTLIYRSVLDRRTRRARQKSKALPLVQLQHNCDAGVTSTVEETLLTQVNGEDKGKEEVNGCSKEVATAVDKKSKPRANSEALKRKSTRGKENNRMANLKTAAMLFVVTVVFIITFLPAFLMALEMIPYNMVIFYMYFANNVANPVIYSFMNKNFRDDLKRIFCKTQIRL